jgi:hypothetical protein
MAKFTYQTEATRKSNIPYGQYTFKVLDAYLEGEGNKARITLELELSDSSGKKYYTKTGLMHFLRDTIQSFWVSVGRPEMFNGENDDTDFLDQTGVLVFGEYKNNKGETKVGVVAFKPATNTVNASTAISNECDIPI